MTDQDYYKRELERMPMPQHCAIKVESRTDKVYPTYNEIPQTRWLSLTPECSKELVKHIIAGYGAGIVMEAVKEYANDVS